MDEIFGTRIVSSPIYQRLIDFTRISLPLLIFSYPDSDIELTGFVDTQSTTSEKPPRFSPEDEILELFSLPYFLLCLPDILDFFLIGRESGCDIEIYICSTEFARELMNIYSPVEGEWNKYATRSFDTGGSEGEMRVFEK